jgi:hypothetical protein
VLHSQLNFKAFISGFDLICDSEIVDIESKISIETGLFTGYFIQSVEYESYF